MFLFRNRSFHASWSKPLWLPQGYRELVCFEQAGQRYKHLPKSRKGEAMVEHK